MKDASPCSCLSETCDALIELAHFSDAVVTDVTTAICKEAPMKVKKRKTNFEERQTICSRSNNPPDGLHQGPLDPQSYVLTQSQPPASLTVVKPRKSISRRIMEERAVISEGGREAIALRSAVTAVTWTCASQRPGSTYAPPTSTSVQFAAFTSLGGSMRCMPAGGAVARSY